MEFKPIIFKALTHLEIPNLGARIRDGSQENHLNILLSDALQTQANQSGKSVLVQTEVERRDISIRSKEEEGVGRLLCVIEAKAAYAVCLEWKTQNDRYCEDYGKLKKASGSLESYALVWARVLSGIPPEHWRYQFGKRYFDKLAGQEPVAEQLRTTERFLKRIYGECFQQAARRIKVGDNETIDKIVVGMYAYLIPVTVTAQRELTA